MNCTSITCSTIAAEFRNLGRALRATVGLQAENYCDESGNNCRMCRGFMVWLGYDTPDSREYVIEIGRGLLQSRSREPVKSRPNFAQTCCPNFDGVYPWGCQNVRLGAWTVQQQIFRYATPYTAFNLNTPVMPSIPNPTSTGACQATGALY